jgi:hypothetical protein
MYLHHCFYVVFSPVDSLPHVEYTACIPFILLSDFIPSIFLDMLCRQWDNVPSLLGLLWSNIKEIPSHKCDTFEHSIFNMLFRVVPMKNDNPIIRANSYIHCVAIQKCNRQRSAVSVNWWRSQITWLLHNLDRTFKRVIYCSLVAFAVDTRLSL